MDSDFLEYKKNEEYWIDLSKFTQLGIFIASMFSKEDEELPSVVDLIGDPPEYSDSKTKAKEETESEKQWREWAESRGFEVERTSTGLRIKK